MARKKEIKLINGEKVSNKKVAAVKFHPVLSKHPEAHTIKICLDPLLITLQII